eukprot:jgi/Mesvir1/16322/Mv09816-RA.1
MAACAVNRVAHAGISIKCRACRDPQTPGALLRAQCAGIHGRAPVAFLPSARGLRPLRTRSLNLGHNNLASRKFSEVARCSQEQVAVTSHTLEIQVAKDALLSELKGSDRGIFGMPTDKRNKVLALVAALEKLTPCKEPTAAMDQLAGDWRLLFSTIQILGSKRTKLGLRGFVKLGDLIQTVDVAQSRAINEVRFHVAGLGTLRGALTIVASYGVASPTRVDIKFQEASLVPDQLRALFEKNYDLLLAIFNPEGWLEITYPFTRPPGHRIWHMRVCLGRFLCKPLGSRHVWPF